MNHGRTVELQKGCCEGGVGSFILLQISVFRTELFLGERGGVRGGRDHVHAFFMVVEQVLRRSRLERFQELGVLNRRVRLKIKNKE